MSGFSGISNVGVQFAHPPSLAAMSAGNTYFLGYCGISPTETLINSPVSQPFTINKLQVVTGAAPGSGQSQTWTLRKNGIDTAVTCTISGTATSASDTAHSVQFAAGDLIDIKIVMSASATTATTAMASANAVTSSPP